MQPFNNGGTQQAASGASPYASAASAASMLPALMGGNGTVSGATQTSTAPTWALPYQQYGLNQAYQQYKNVNSPQQLVAGFSPLQDQALSGIQNLATNGAPGMNAAGAYVNNVLSGNPASNPYLNSMFNQAANGVQNRLESEFAGSGRNVIGSLPVQSDELNNLATQLYGGAYNTGVQQQEQALSSVPGLANTQLGMQQGLYNAGQQVQNLAQQYITAPQQFLQQYLNQSNQVPGQSTTITGQGNPYMAAAGGAQIGSQLGNSIGSSLGGTSGGNWGSVIGALGGGLLGGLG